VPVCRSLPKTTEVSEVPNKACELPRASVRFPKTIILTLSSRQVPTLHALGEADARPGDCTATRGNSLVDQENSVCDRDGCAALS
jgi:hypothetical protein